MASEWLTWAQRIQALASTGAHFGASEFDVERYEELGEIAHAMLQQITDAPLETLETLPPEFASGYATPQIDVRGALMRGDQILLVREKADGLWTLPGGYADVGFSAAENCAKEIFEEAGLEVQVTRLIAVRHKAKHPYRPDIRDFYKFLFLCADDAEQMPQAGMETLDARMFGRHEIPELSTGRVLLKDIELAFDAFADPSLPAVFD